MPKRRGSNGQFASNGGRSKKPKLTQAQKAKARLRKAAAKKRAIREGKRISDRTIKKFAPFGATSSVSDARRRGNVLHQAFTEKVVHGPGPAKAKKASKSIKKKVKR